MFAFRSCAVVTRKSLALDTMAMNERAQTLSLPLQEPHEITLPAFFLSAPYNTRRKEGETAVDGDGKTALVLGVS